MASKLVQPSILALPRTTNRARARADRLSSQTLWRSRSASFSDFPSWLSPIYTPRVAEQTAGVVSDDTLVQIKSELYQAVEGLNRGIFGVTSAKRSEIEGLVSLLESQNPTPDPTLNLEKVSGCWRLIYSTITILGSKRTKLGLRDFISLGDFLQIIDINKGKAVNVIKFSVRGLNMLNGQLAIEASFKIASKLRVDISYDNSTITPAQLMSLFHKNYHLLLSIFNPEGWLEITETRFENCYLTRSNHNRYVDDTMRIGRDGKGNIFVLDRSKGGDS